MVITCSNWSDFFWSCSWLSCEGVEILGEVFELLLRGFGNFLCSPVRLFSAVFPRLARFVSFVLDLCPCASALCLVRICSVDGTKHVLWVRYVSSQWTVSSFVVGVVLVRTAEGVWVWVFKCSYSPPSSRTSRSYKSHTSPVSYSYYIKYMKNIRGHI